MRQCVFEFLLEKKLIYEVIISPTQFKKLGFKLSEQLNSANLHIKCVREEDPGIRTDDDMWEEISRIQSCTVNVWHQLIQFKLTHRLHYCKSKQQKIFPQSLFIFIYLFILCDRCRSTLIPPF